MSKKHQKAEIYLERWCHGSDRALEALWQAVYTSDLLPLAKALLRGDRCEHWLEAEDLVSGAFLRLARLQKRQCFAWTDFWKILRCEMKREILDLRRWKEASKRGGRDQGENLLSFDTLHDLIQ